MKLKLNDIVDAQFGLVLNRKEDKTMKSKIKYQVIQSKSVKDDLIYLDNISSFHSKEEIDDVYLTKVNDILFKVTEPFDTVLIDEDTSGLLVASNFIILRVNNDRVYSRFLHWYLGRPKIKNKIRLMTQGTSIIAIRTSDLLDLIVNVPTLERQKQVVEFLKLADQEIELLRELLINKEILYKQIPEEILKNKNIIQKYGGYHG
jgi:restriction endonuclease S subunit